MIVADDSNVFIRWYVEIHTFECKNVDKLIYMNYSFFPYIGPI